MTFRITTGKTKPQILQRIQLDSKQKKQFEDMGVMFSPSKIDLASFVDSLKPVKEETVKNPDGTTSTVKTYGDGSTVTSTMKKDGNGQEYEETIRKRKDGSLLIETIKYPGKSEDTKLYDEQGNLETQLNKTYAEDGKTVKTEDQVNYNGKNANGDPIVRFERHTYENGNKSEIYYDENGKPQYANITTKEGKNAAELTFDLKDSQLEAGNVKLDEHGWPITKDGKHPRISQKVTNPGLPTETTTNYEYREDGTISETTYKPDRTTFELNNIEVFFCPVCNSISHLKPF